LGRPGGNITGFSFIDFPMLGKWLEMPNLTESHSLLAMAAVILLRRGNGIGWRPAAAGDVR
jgi:hypothetical protein